MRIKSMYSLRLPNSFLINDALKLFIEIKYDLNFTCSTWEILLCKQFILIILNYITHFKNNKLNYNYSPFISRDFWKLLYSNE